ncbi:MAG: PCRF domain-containing protein, partial [Myxococcota bacterium]
MRERAARLEEEAGQPDLWDDRERAEKLLKRKRGVDRELKLLERLTEAVEDAEVLLELAREADDAEALAEAG